MTREQHLAYCKICTNRSFNPQYGIVCSITNQVADFDPTCANFNPQADAVAPHPSDQWQHGGARPFDARAARATSGQRLANYII